MIPIDKLLDEVQWAEIEPPTNLADPLPYVTHEGILEIGPYKLRCLQLSSGQRVFDSDDFDAFMADLTDV